METIFKVVKSAGSLVISMGVGAIARNLMTSTTPNNVNKIAKFCIGMGAFYVAGIAAKAAGEKFEGSMDQIEKTIKVWTTDDKVEVKEVSLEEG